MTRNLDPTHVFGAAALTLLLIGGYCMYASSGISSSNEVTRSQVSSLKNARAREERTLARLEDMLADVPDSEPPELKSLVPRRVRQIKAGVKHYDVQISELTLGAQQSQARQAITHYAESSAFPGVRLVPVSLRGSWGSLDGLRKWVAQVNRGTTAITDLAIEDSNFEMTIKIYGT